MLSKKIRNLEKYGVWLNKSSCYEDNGYDACAAQEIMSQCVHETQERVTGSIAPIIGGPIYKMHTVGND